MARRYKPLPAGQIVWLHAGQWCQGRGWVLEDPGLHAGRLAVLVLIDDGSGRPMSAQQVPGAMVVRVARRNLVTEDERARRAAALALANALAAAADTRSAAEVLASQVDGQRATWAPADPAG